MLKVCSGVTNEKEKDGGARGPVELWSEGPRVTGAPTCAGYSSMWEVLPYSPCMADDDTHNTVDTQRHVGDFTVFAWYGS